MKRTCIIKAVLVDGVDPNALPLEGLHAACVRMMTQFVAHPSPHLATCVSAMLEAIGAHEGAYRAPHGQNLYAETAAAWSQFSDLLDRQSSPSLRRHH